MCVCHCFLTSCNRIGWRVLIYLERMLSTKVRSAQNALCWRMIAVQHVAFVEPRGTIESVEFLLLRRDDDVYGLFGFVIGRFLLRDILHLRSGSHLLCVSAILYFARFTSISRQTKLGNTT